MTNGSLSRDIHELLRCKSLQELLDTARRFVGNPMILADLTYHVLAITGESGVDDPRWHQIHSERTIPVDIVNTGLFQSALRSEAPVLTTDATGLPVVRCAISMEERLIGYLLSPCHNGTPTQEQMDLMRVLTDLCALRMQKDLHYGEYPENVLEFFVSDLLNGAITDEQQILDRCRYFGWSLKPPYRTLTIQARGRNDSGSGYLELEKKRQWLQRQFPDATAFLYGNQIRFLAPVHDQSTQDAVILRELTQFMTEHDMIAGVSQTSNRLSQLAGRHRQALKALELGQLLGGEGPLYYYDAYAVYHCLELCAPQMNLLELCHTAVLRLESYDRKNGTELLGSLHAYLSCHRSLSEAAASLYIHRNTLSKRLDKINDLIRMDFDDAETVFHLMFSYRIIEYYGATVLRDSYENWVEKAPTLRHP